VAAAVGLDTDRGDQLTVENISFDVPATTEGTPAAALPAAPAAPAYMRWVYIGAGVAGGVILLVVVVLLARGSGKKQQPQRRAAAALPAQAGKTELPQPGALPKTVSDLQTDIEAQLNAEVEKATGAQKLPALARRVGNLATKEPEAVALLVRSWMAEDRR
jgi:flagellar M-ring protein FliF